MIALFSSLVMLLTMLCSRCLSLDQAAIDEICDPGVQLNAHPEDCNKYIQCHHGMGFERDCPARSMRFNVILGICDWNFNTECNENGDAKILRRLGCWFDNSNSYNTEFSTDSDLPDPIAFNITDMTPYLEACVRSARLRGVENFAVSFDGRCLTSADGEGGGVEGVDLTCTINNIPDGGMIGFFFETPTPKRAGSVVDFGLLVLCSTGANPLSYNGYGCYCGLGGYGTPVDETDNCCKLHDECYDAIQTNGKCSFSASVYLVPYSWDGCNPTVCKPPSYYWFFGTCRNAVCECDAAAAQCFSRHRNTFSTSYVDYDKAGKC